MAIYPLLTDDELYERVSLVLKDFVKEEKLKEKIIILKDVLSCIPPMENRDEEINVFEHKNKYLCFIHQNPFIQYLRIKQKVIRKKRNAILVIKREHPVFDGLIRSNPIPINPKKLLDNYCYVKTNRNPFLSDDINILRYLIWNSIDFIVDNIDRYQKKNNLEDRHILEMVFQEIINKEEESEYFLRHLLLNKNFIIEIFEKPIFNKLKERIIGYINKYLPNSLVKLILKSIINKDFDQIFKVLLLISYIKQFDEKVSNFMETFKYINDAVNLIDFFDIDNEIQSLKNEITKIARISDNLLRNLLNLYLNNKELGEIIRVRFDFPKLIRKIESKIVITHKNKTTNRYTFFPSFEKFTTKIYLKIPNIWLSYDFLLIFIKICIQIFIDKHGSLKNYNKKNLIAQNFKAIDSFKKNIFYLIGNPNSEYWIKLSYIEKYLNLIFYLRYIDTKLIPDLDEDYEDDAKWSYIYQKFYIPLIFGLEELIEDKLQFISGVGDVALPVFINQYSVYLENCVTIRLKKIDAHFKNYLENNYIEWVKDVNNPTTPINVVNVIKRLILPEMVRKPNRFFLFLIIDSCHLGIWNFLKQIILDDFEDLKIESKIGHSILPTSTEFARSALFSGKYPRDINSNNEASEFISLIKRVDPRIPSYGKKKLFITHCENIFDYGKNIESIKESHVRYQVSIFNFADEISHGVSQTFLKSLITTLYKLKIRPLIELIKNSKPDMLIFFATDHGNSRSTAQMNWINEIFHNFINRDYHKNFILRGPRVFISDLNPTDLGPDVKKFITIKSSKAEDWGLKKEMFNKRIRTTTKANYYLANNFTNLKNTLSHTLTLENFGHGGITMNEFIIPFALFTKKESSDIDFNWEIEIETRLEDLPEDDHLLKYFIQIKNISNKEIVFHEGHIITDFIHHKFLIYKENRNIISNKPLSNKIIFDDIKFSRRYYGRRAYFYFTFFQEEKFEKSPNYFF